jgi:hypothetical protein
VPLWQISSAREQTYQFGFFTREKKKKERREKFMMQSVLD